MKLSGITIFTNNISQLTDFYNNLLNMEPLESTEMSSLFVIDGFRYFIHKNHEPSPDLPPSENHFEFEVKDVKQSIEELIKKGLKVEFPPKNYYWGKSAYLRDLDGRLIEIHEGLIK